MSRIELAKISSLTFYKGEYTAARRTPAISQLVCRGKPCKLFQPEAVRCVNLGGAGVDVDWKVGTTSFGADCCSSVIDSAKPTYQKLSDLEKLKSLVRDGRNLGIHMY